MSQDVEPAEHWDEQNATFKTEEVNALDWVKV